MKKHFTATVYIVSRIDDKYKVLLHCHKKLGIWIAIGGHIERNENPAEAVLREAKEETNLEIKILSSNALIKNKNVSELPKMMALIEEKVPAYNNEKAHLHMDCIYFAICQNPKQIKMDGEYRWFSKKDLQKGQLEEEVFILAKRALDYYA